MPRVGRRMLVVPPGVDTLKAERILMGWKESAKRVVRSATPFRCCTRPSRWPSSRAAIAASEKVWPESTSRTWPNTSPVTGYQFDRPRQACQSMASLPSDRHSESRRRRSDRH
jgi:hypothetical protein